MRTITRPQFEAFDGTIFDNERTCREHEKLHAPERLVGLTLEQINGAINRADPELGDAIERTAYLVQQARRSAGDYKRRPSDTPTDTDVPAEEPHDSETGELLPDVQL